MPPQASARVLLVGGDARLEGAIQAAGYSVLRAREGGDFYELIERERPDAVVIAADSPSRDVFEHLATLNRRHPQPVVLFHDGRDDALVRRALKAGVSAYVALDLPPLVLRSLIEVATHHFEQTRSLKQELSRAQRAQAERRTIDAAKCRIMETLGLPEAAAYEHLRARAMGARRPLAEVAREILGSGWTSS